MSTLKRYKQLPFLKFRIFPTLHSLKYPSRSLRIIFICLPFPFGKLIFLNICKDFFSVAFTCIRLFVAHLLSCKQKLPVHKCYHHYIFPCIMGIHTGSCYVRCCPLHGKNIPTIKNLQFKFFSLTVGTWKWKVTYWCLYTRKGTDLGLENKVIMPLVQCQLATEK